MYSISSSCSILWTEWSSDGLTINISLYKYALDVTCNYKIKEVVYTNQIFILLSICQMYVLMFL